MLVRLRLAQWEALEARETGIVDEDERRRRWGVAVERIRAEQGAGRLVADLDPDLLLLAMVALTTFPVASPPVVRLVTGANPGSRSFRARYASFLHRLAEHLSSPTGSSTAETRRRS